MPANAWDVYVGNKIIDTVFFDKDCDEWYVKHALINHDGYPSNIEVKLAR